MFYKKGCLFLSISAALLVGGAAQSQTIAYYRFEEGVAGAKVQTTGDDIAPASSPVLDSSGNGNHMKTFNANTGPVYSVDVSSSTVPQTGAANSLSLDFEPNQDIYSQGATNLNSFAFSAFTIEASFNLDSLDRWNGLVVKDGNVSGSLPSLVLKVRNDNDRVQIEIVDGSNTVREVSSTFAPTVGTWYSVAAVNDGSNLSLYMKSSSDAAYVLQGTTPVAAGLAGGPSNWGIGRGWFNGPNDWTDGRIDEVRISGTALNPSQFLATVPAPSSLIALLVGSVPGLCIVLRRKRRTR